MSRTRTVSLAAAGLLLAGVIAAPPSSAQEIPRAQAAPATVDSAVPGVDEISSSPNLRQVANLPKQGPFDTTSALGTDIAFQGRYAFVGNYEGFVIYDVSRPSRPAIVSQVLCPGSQNDISVTGDLLFLSTDSSRSDDSCASTAQPASVKESWEGIKIFDIRDKRNPRYIKSVETACGSHTHTLVPGKDAAQRLPLRLVVQPAGRVPGLPAAARLHLHRQGAGEEPHHRRRGRHPEPLPRRRLPGHPGSRRPPPPAATTSPRTRRRTWPPARAWVTGSCWTSRTGKRRGSSNGSPTR